MQVIESWFAISMQSGYKTRVLGSELISAAAMEKSAFDVSVGWHKCKYLTSLYLLDSGGNECY